MNEVLTVEVRRRPQCGGAVIEGPKWVPCLEEVDGQRRIPMPPCAACTELALVDKETGLCRACWRGWRWAGEVVRALVQVMDSETIKKEHTSSTWPKP